MVSPYRAGEPPKALTCPRCNKAKLPPTDVAACEKGCGTWVSQFASTEVLTEVDRKRDPVTRWWRVRAPCPVCAEQMLLYGDEPGLFQGCDLHGYFIDADMIRHTGLARGVDQAALDLKRNDTPRVEAERDALYAAEQKREQERMLQVRRNQGFGVDERARQFEAEVREARVRGENERSRVRDNELREARARADDERAGHAKDEIERREAEHVASEWRAERRARVRSMLPPGTSDAFVNYVVGLEERIAALEELIGCE